jgi:hypothetical protein
MAGYKSLAIIGSCVVFYKHGMSKTRTFKSWDSMKQRCTNPNDPSYERYGWDIVEKSRKDGLCYDVNSLLAEALVKVLNERNSLFLETVQESRH